MAGRQLLVRAALRPLPRRPPAARHPGLFLPPRPPAHHPAPPRPALPPRRVQCNGCKRGVEVRWGVAHFRCPACLTEHSSPPEALGPAPTLDEAEAAFAAADAQGRPEPADVKEEGLAAQPAEADGWEPAGCSGDAPAADSS